MKRLFDIFRLRRGEVRPAIVAVVFIAAVNALFVYKMYDVLTPLYDRRVLLGRMIRHFHVSGYDPLTLVTISSWTDIYNVFRHPLLAFLISPLSALNSVLVSVTGINCALFITAVLMTACAFYSFVFLRRILTDVLCLGTFDSNLLTALFFSFSYVMLISFVPDHFGFTMCMLLMVLYVAGMRMKRGKAVPTWQTAVLYVFATGITTTNSVKIILAQLFVNGRRFFWIRNLLLAIIVPSIALWMFCRYEYDTFVAPIDKARHEARLKRQAAKRHNDSIRMAKNRADTALTAKRAALTDKAPAAKKKTGKQGRPIADTGMMRWSDMTTPRTATVVENLFGEPIQFHRQHFLGDIFHHRPVFVRYDWTVNYLVEGLVVLLFLAGIVCGLRNRFLWLCLAWFACDMALHLGLGFGINEIYIMSPHWLFVIPIAMAFCLLRIRGGRRTALRILMVCLTAYLWIYNGWLLGAFLLIPAT